MHPRVLEVTERLVERSRKTRERYLAMMAAAASEGLSEAGCNAPTSPMASPAAIPLRTSRACA